MAVNINTVYQRVLAIANKEQRGYITPQEFNLLANQAQLDIFEQYFYDLNQFNRIPGNETKYADMVDIIEEKISVFEKFRQDVTMGSGGVGTLPSNTHKLGTVSYNTGSGGYVEIEHINQNELNNYINSPLTSPTATRPIYIKTSETAIQVYPTTITSAVTCNYIAKPASVNWNYTNVLGEPLYNSTNSTNFELHESEETELVLKVLELTGLTIKSPDLYQIGDKEDIEDIQQEKL
tara:strand:- start:1198 stop:1905 length:708 start_codon:yes stop_codon:yes gene_type:complete